MSKIKGVSLRRDIGLNYLQVLVKIWLSQVRFKRLGQNKIISAFVISNKLLPYLVKKIPKNEMQVSA